MQLKKIKFMSYGHDGEWDDVEEDEVDHVEELGIVHFAVGGAEDFDFAVDFVAYGVYPEELGGAV